MALNDFLAWAEAYIRYIDIELRFCQMLLEAEYRYNPYQPRNALGQWCKEGVSGTTSPNSIDISAESGIIELRKEFKTTIKGTRAANGITVSDISIHAMERMLQRKVSSADVKETLSNPFVTHRSETDETCSVFDRGRTHVVLNDSGKIITVAVNK